MFAGWFRLLLHVTINIVLMEFKLVTWYLNEDIQVYMCFHLDVSQTPYCVYQSVQYVYWCLISFVYFKMEVNW